jgi:hypothetical protein
LSELLDECVDVRCSGFPVHLEVVDNPPNQPFVVIDPVAQGFYEAHSGVVHRKNLQRVNIEDDATMVRQSGV